jgi:hypothetical protein
MQHFILYSLPGWAGTDRAEMDESVEVLASTADAARSWKKTITFC